MITALAVISVIFIGIGFLVTESNAKYLLAGYNTMSDIERQNFDIKSYIPFFRKFNIFLGVSLFIITLVLYYFVDPDWSGIFMILYPILAYGYFTWASKRFMNLQDKKLKRKRIIAIGVLVAVLLGVSGMLIYSLQDNTIIVHRETIEIKGEYGMTIDVDNIQTITLVDAIPPLALKLNGFAMANVKKGYFKTKSGQKIKLLLNNSTPPYVCIELKDGFHIYYSSKKESNQIVFNKLNQVMN